MTLRTTWQTATSPKFARFSWFVVGYTVLVILWGAYVRATGSGAGCGSHWPTCNGAVIPRPEQIETIIEFSHRLTSAVLGLLSVVQLVWAYWLVSRRDKLFLAALAAFLLVIVEGAIGAALVRFELVAGDTSSARAFVIGLHLVNTLFLLAALTLTAWWASGGRPLAIRERPKLALGLAFALGGLLLIGAFGAITALGDTLFPTDSLVEGLAQDFDQAAHFAVRLRVWHPVVAILVSLYTAVFVWTTEAVRATPLRRQLAHLLLGLIGLQLALGFLNVLLLAPVWLQLVHLLLADGVWVVLVALAAAVLEKQARPINPTIAKTLYSTNGHTVRSAEVVTRKRK